MANDDSLHIWEMVKPLIHRGYQALDKHFVLAVPAVSFPSAENTADAGIGSPYGQGAAEFKEFFAGVADDFLLTPTGETFPPEYSPYTSTLGYNPQLIPLERIPFVSEKDIDFVYEDFVPSTEINYRKVAEKYNFILKKSFDNFQKKLSGGDKKASDLDRKLKLFIEKSPYIAIDATFYHRGNERYYFYVQLLGAQVAENANYIGDIPVKIPASYVNAFPKAFLKEVTLGVPPDMFVDKAENWGFPVLNPEKMFKGKSLGTAGKLYFDIFDNAFKNNRAGLRIDHFIGVVNPFVIPLDDRLQAGRLFSSEDNPILAKYARHSLDEFAQVAERIILAAAKKNDISNDKIYAEDIGTRPPQIDYVLQKLGWGRMLVSQFVEPENPYHIYRLKNALPNDIAVLDTHDMESVQDFFEKMSDENRAKHAIQLQQDLRFNYAPDLVLPKNLMRMKWAELMASPARRVMTFFTSFTGQEGRFNEPKNDVKWLLRCRADYKQAYFKNLKAGRAYNPFDAICLGLWARGDECFCQNKDLIDDLRAAESELLASIE